VILVRGDRVLAEPMGSRLAAALGEIWGVAPHARREVDDLAVLTADLRTFSLFEPGKIVVVGETGILADRAAAAALVESLREALPVELGGELSGAARTAARRLLQILRLHDVDPGLGAPERVLAALPDEVLSAGKGKSGAPDLREQLAPLLAAALAAGLRGTGEEETSLIADLLRDGLPPRHLLVLVESAVAAGHPLLDALERRGAVLEAGRLAAEKGGRVSGLDALIDQLGTETGSLLRMDAAAELARRTLRLEDSRRPGGEGGIDADSAARFAAEYRKLATLAGAGGIDRALVRENVEDRGEEEVWPILDALADGNAEGALAKIRRRITSAEDPLVERLSLFGLLSGFAKQVAAVGGALQASAPRRGNSSSPVFSERVVVELQKLLAEAGLVAMARLQPFRLRRAFRLASRLPADRLARLPALTLEVERRLKGDSADPDSALVAFVLALSGPRSIQPGKEYSSSKSRK
jgi:hypothetical protein